MFEARVKHDMPCALQKIIMVDVSGHILWLISRICSKKKNSIWRNLYISTTTVPIATKLGRVVIQNEGFPHIRPHNTYVNTWLCCLLRSRDKSRTLYLYFQNGYWHQTWHDGKLPWWITTHKVAWPWPFDHVVLWDYVRSSNHYISTIPVPMPTKLCNLVVW